MAACSRRAWLAGCAAGAVWPVASAATDSPAGAQRSPWPPGRPTPGLALPAWEGPPFTLAAARGQVLLLNFWASWCAPCRDEMPSLELLAQRHEADRLQVLAVNFRETDATIRRFIDQTALTLPILRDTDGAAAKAWQVRIFPSTVAIGRNGRAAFTVVGELDWTGPTARAWIASLL